MTPLVGQRSSPGPHLRGWGCKIHALLAMGQLYYNVRLTPEQIRQITLRAIARGDVLDNNIPIDKPGWYRCFVVNGRGLIQATWPDCRAREVSRGDKPAAPYDFCEIEWQTATGSHFGLGEYLDGVVKTIYDPWPELARIKIKSLRFWRFS